MAKKEEQWKELIKNYNQSDKTQKQWCKGNGYQYYYKMLQRCRASVKHILVVISENQPQPEL